MVLNLRHRPGMDSLMDKRIGLCLIAAALLAQPAMAASWDAVDAAFGRSGVDQAQGVRRYSFPRSDLNVSLDGVRVRPTLALGSWIVFQPHGNETMVMGDLVLLHEEVNPVLSRLLASGLTITALHNHLLRSEPATMYMHVHGRGDPARIAAAIRSALDLTGTPTSQPSAPSRQPMPLNAPALDGIIGTKGSANGGVLQYSIPRKEKIRDGGMVVPASMGLGTVINIQPTSAGRALATGDFVLTGPEVPRVLKALRNNGIEVTALHNHLSEEEPRLFFLHFWGNAEAVRLATALKQALNQTNVALGQP